MRSGLRHFFCNAPLAEGRSVKLPDDLQHRLAKVLRLGEGDEVALFNGKEGLFSATLADAKCRSAQVAAQFQAQPAVKPAHLYLGIPKREAWESALRQATELGITDIHPLLTAHAVPTRMNDERAQALVVEAAEQCERLTVPTLHSLIRFEDWLAALSQPTLWAHPAATSGTASVSGVLVGPEGGFSAAEEKLLSAHPHIRPVTFGPTILRTDTAVVAAVTRLFI